MSRRPAEGRRVHLGNAPLPLDGGGLLHDWAIAYESWGQLNAAASNAVLICHALTSDCHVTSGGADGIRAGWWEGLVGPGRTIDTDRYYVICANVLGGSDGSTSPASREPGTDRAYGMRLPLLSVGDIVRAQAGLLDALGVDRLHAVIGGCFGGFQALTWGCDYPARAPRIGVLSARLASAAYSMALWHVVREAIRLDPDWRGGDYYETGVPTRGIGLATTMGLLHWMAPALMEARYGRRRQSNDRPGMAADFEVEHMLTGVARRAGETIDPNTLLYLTRSMDYFDLTERFASASAEWLAGTQALVVNYHHDVRYPPEEGRRLADALQAAGARTRFLALESKIAHGAFLLDTAGIVQPIADLLEASD
jgi:homoserine O-acetyltransferase